MLINYQSYCGRCEALFNGVKCPHCGWQAMRHVFLSIFIANVTGTSSLKDYAFTN